MLGTEPSFVDGERWAQFDVGPQRIALAGEDRESERAGLMVKVDELDAFRQTLLESGLEVGADVEGPHETRFTAVGPGGWPITAYAPGTSVVSHK